MASLSEQDRQLGRNGLHADTKPRTLGTLINEGIASGRSPLETLAKVGQLVEYGILERDGKKIFPTDTANALEAEQLLGRIAKVKHLEKIDDIPEELQMEVVRRFGFKTKEEMAGLLQKLSEAIKQRKNERAGH